MSKWILVSGALLLLGLGWQNANLHQEVESTQAALVQAQAESQRWLAAYQMALTAMDAQKENAERCLQSLASAQRASLAREQLLREAKMQSRSPAQKEEVVDDATRRKAAQHLNRAW